jgi:hypothetical protein
MVDAKHCAFAQRNLFFGAIKERLTGIIAMTIEQANVQRDHSGPRENFARPRPMT